MLSKLICLFELRFVCVLSVLFCSSRVQLFMLHNVVINTLGVCFVKCWAYDTPKDYITTEKTAQIK